MPDLTAAEEAACLWFMAKLHESGGRLAMSVREFAVHMDRSRSWAHRLLTKLVQRGLVTMKTTGRHTTWDSGGTVSDKVAGTVGDLVTTCEQTVKHGVSEDVGTVAGTVAGTVTGQSSRGAKVTNLGVSNLLSETGVILGLQKEEKENPLWGQKKETKKVHQLGSRLSEDWSLPREWGDWACREMGWTQRETVAEAAMFRDYWVGTAGAKARKVDWFATWRNWCRNSRREKRGSASPVLRL